MSDFRFIFALFIRLVIGLGACTRISVPTGAPGLAQDSEQDELKSTVAQIIEKKSREQLGEAFQKSTIDSVETRGPDITEITYTISSRSPAGDDQVAKSYTGTALLHRGENQWRLEKIEAVSQELQFETA